MNNKPPQRPGLRDFLHDLRRGHPLFWLAAAIVATIFLARWLAGAP